MQILKNYIIKKRAIGVVQFLIESEEDLKILKGTDLEDMQEFLNRHSEVIVFESQKECADDWFKNPISATLDNYKRRLEGADALILQSSQQESLVFIASLSYDSFSI